MAKIGIAGAGIIGAACAAWLLSEGHAVTVFEADPNGLPASTGNAGLLALSEIEPLARWSVLKSVPRWLADPHGPLALRAGDAPALLPWLTLFMLNARPGKIEQSRRALASLLSSALADHEELAAWVGLTGHIRHTGSLTVYDNQASLDAAMAGGRALKALLDVTLERLSPAEARARAPELEGAFAGATCDPSYRAVSDPKAILRHLQARIREQGRLAAARVRSVVPADAQAELVTGDGERHAFDFVVVAAGVWSRDLVRPLGLKLPLETERGYNTTFQSSDLVLSLPIFFADHGFVATPLECGLRVGGAVELARPESPMNPARAAALCGKMRRYVPRLPRNGGIEWMGCRPSTPDSLPVIGRHPGNRRVLFAFGHGHLGLTLSAVTGRAISDLIADRDNGRLDAFSIDRFQRN